MNIDSTYHLRRQVLLYTLLISSVLTAIITALSLHQDYQRGLDAIDQSLSQIQATVVPSLSGALWNFDESLVATQAEGLLNFPSVFKIEVQPDQDMPAVVRSKTPIHSESGVYRHVNLHSIPLVYVQGGENKKLGLLKVWVQRDELWAVLIGKIFSVFVAQLIKTFIVSAAILWILNTLIVRHLRDLGEIFASFNLNELGSLKPIRLPRKNVQQDEIDLLVDRTNLMIEKTKEVVAQNNILRLEAESANHAKSRFLSMISHELRTPLNSVLGNAEHLRSSSFNPEQANSLGRLRASADQLNLIIQQVLDFTRMDSEVFNLHPENVNIERDILTPIEEILAPRMDDQRVQYQKEIGFKCEEVHADPLRFRQILLNLLEYALIEGGGHSVGVKVSLDEVSQKLQIVVWHSGPGLAPEEADRIFDPFFQPHATLRDRRPGIGIGLSLTKKIVNSMKGSLTFVTQKSAGSRFELRLPYVAPVAIIKPDQSKTTSVLVVDDAPDNRYIAQVFLGTVDGAVVQTAVNGLEAVEKCAANDFDVILMDLEMPVLDGFSAIMEIQKRNPQQRFVIVTGHALPTFKERALTLGVRDFLVKPIKRAELIRIVFGEGSVGIR